MDSSTRTESFLLFSLMVLQISCAIWSIIAVVENRVCNPVPISSPFWNLQVNQSLMIAQWSVIFCYIIARAENSLCCVQPFAVHSIYMYRHTVFRSLIHYLFCFFMCICGRGHLWAWQKAVKLLKLKQCALDKKCFSIAESQLTINSL